VTTGFLPPLWGKLYTCDARGESILGSWEWYGVRAKACRSGQQPHIVWRWQDEESEL
jgi:hypothetical protein